MFDEWIVPESYFYATDDDADWLLVTFHRMNAEQRRLLIDGARELTSCVTISR